MGITNYVMDDRGNIRAESDIHKWAAWYETADRTIGKDTVGEVRISTVFLGLDHSYGDGAPILFETMIFGGDFDGSQERYCTKAEAAIGHERWVAYIKSGAKPDIQREFSRN